MTTDYRELYEKIWGASVYRVTSPAERLVPDIIALLRPEGDREPGSLLDWGCGSGRATRLLQEAGFNAVGIDVAHNCLDERVAGCFPLIVASFAQLQDTQLIEADFSICVDVLEHINEDEVYPAVMTIEAKTRKQAFIRVANFKESHGEMLGTEQLHRIFRDAAWWENELGNHFYKVTRLYLMEDGRYDNGEWQEGGCYSFLCETDHET